eukprot:scaffold33955_cov57-Attheya_sp.AAC.1
MATVMAATALKLSRRKRKFEEVMNDLYTFKEPKRRGPRTKYDRERVLKCVQDDWLGPNPLFKDHQFERQFRITRGIMEKLISDLPRSDAFFRHRSDAANKPGIHAEVKIIAALKHLCYGTTYASTNVDYLQMDQQTVRECVRHFARGVHEEYSNTYLRGMTRADAKRVTAMHNDIHGIPGYLGNLDCMHQFWKNCPKAWQGHFQGSKGKPTIVLEASADYNLWFWHVACGFPGTMNDINIWEISKLHKQFIDGTFTKEVDAPFTIAGEIFTHMFFLVDGIYPCLARFVKALCEAIGVSEEKFAAWQEHCRKSIERAFGVLQRKFLCLVHASEDHNLQDIKMKTMACVILHNMMVQHRIENGEVENRNFYTEYPIQEQQEVGLVENNNTTYDTADELVAARLAVQDRNRQLQEEPQFADTEDVMQIENRDISIDHLPETMQVVHERWAALTDIREHVRLKKAIMRHLVQQAAEGGRRGENEAEEFYPSDNDDNSTIF